MMPNFWEYFITYRNGSEIRLVATGAHSLILNRLQSVFRRSSRRYAQSTLKSTPWLAPEFSVNHD